MFLALLLALTACTDGGAKKVPPDPDAELRDARARLAVLAQATANGTYDAEYRFLQLPSNTAGTIRIRQAPPQYRIDIQSRGGASFFSLKTGTVSCSARNTTQGRKRTCFLVAKPGEPVPQLFDPGVQRLFRDAVADLAENPGNYLVTRVDAPPAATPTGTPTGTSSGTTAPLPPTTTPPATTSPSGTASPSGSTLPTGECFRVERTSANTKSPGTEAGFEDGTYCFAEEGVATSITVASGTLTLVILRGAPEANAFNPPAKVQELPAVSPSPSKK